MLKENKRTLLIGIGNYGRSDDALGWEFVDVFASHDDLFDIEYRYQLQIEDAELITQYDEVIFVDASQKPLPEGFAYYACKPAMTAAFTTHKLEPEMVLWLADDLYGRQPKAWVMAIEGNAWELNHGLSDHARENLVNAIAYFMALINKLEPSITTV
jgi:hydrogenase maturation protease